MDASICEVLLVAETSLREANLGASMVLLSLSVQALTASSRAWYIVRLVKDAHVRVGSYLPTRLSHCHMSERSPSAFPRHFEAEHYGQLERQRGYFSFEERLLVSLARLAACYGERQPNRRRLAKQERARRIAYLFACLAGFETPGDHFSYFYACESRA